MNERDAKNAVDGYPSGPELARMFDEARAMVQRAGSQMETIQRCLVGRLSQQAAPEPASDEMVGESIEAGHITPPEETGEEEAERAQAEGREKTQRAVAVLREEITGDDLSIQDREDLADHVEKLEANAEWAEREKADAERALDLAYSALSPTGSYLLDPPDGGDPDLHVMISRLVQDWCEAGGAEGARRRRKERGETSERDYLGSLRHLPKIEPCDLRPIAGEPAARTDSGTYGELPAPIRAMIVNYEWDNMTRDEQRAWLIDRLATRPSVAGAEAIVVMAPAGMSDESRRHLHALGEAAARATRDETSEERTMTTMESPVSHDDVARALMASRGWGAEHLDTALWCAENGTDDAMQIRRALEDYEWRRRTSRVAGGPAARTEVMEDADVRVARETIDFLAGECDASLWTEEIKAGHAALDRLATRPSAAGAEAIVVTDAMVLASRDAERVWWRKRGDFDLDDKHRAQLEAALRVETTAKDPTPTSEVST